MTHYFDEKTISSFIDGELDTVSMIEVDQFIQGDNQAKNFILDSVRATAMMKADLNMVEHEEVPEHLLRAVRSHPSGSGYRGRTLTYLARMAVAIVLVVTGYSLTWFQGNGENGKTPLQIVPFLSQYSHLLETTLENSISGTPTEWQNPENLQAVTITPIKTYRDNKRRYYREYRFQIQSRSGQQEIRGLAYRQTGGRWKTQAIFL